MKRLIFSGALLVLAIASIVLAQAPGQAILRLPSGDRPLTWFQQGGATFVSATDVVTALGGSIAPDNAGYKVTINNNVAAFGTDSRYGVIRDDLIEMPVPPVTVEGKPFVPWQFFQVLLPKATDVEANWDPAARVLAIRPKQQNTVSVQASLANVQGISKLVLTLSAPAEYSIVKEPAAYVVRFRTPVRPAAAEQAFDDPSVTRMVFQGNDLRVELKGEDIVADAYKLENPFRIVLDFRKGAAPVQGQTPQPAMQKPVDLPGIRTIVIDAGHGGKDVGAMGPSGLMEKNATLAVARKLADSIAAKTGARVVMTREDDTLIALDQRTAIANQYKADLFLSVHMNAAVVKGAKGAETYFLSLEASDELAKKAAESENASTAASASSSSGDLNLILWDLAQQEYLHESSRFAQSIQEEMNAVTGVTNRGVKQAPFKVLVGATMPAALVEVSFITNPEEETKIQSEEFQNVVVDAITRAVVRYKTDFETRMGIIQPPAAPAPLAPGAKPATPGAAPAAPAPAPAAVPATTTARTSTR